MLKVFQISFRSGSDLQNETIAVKRFKYVTCHVKETRQSARGF